MAEEKGGEEKWRKRVSGRKRGSDTILFGTPFLLA